jgi:hypothetical protein
MTFTEKVKNWSLPILSLLVLLSIPFWFVIECNKPKRVVKRTPPVVWDSTRCYTLKEIDRMQNLERIIEIEEDQNNEGD